MRGRDVNQRAAAPTAKVEQTFAGQVQIAQNQIHLGCAARRQKSLTPQFLKKSYMVFVIVLIAHHPNPGLISLYPDIMR